MKFEKIEERAALWPEYWAHIMEEKNYGLDDLNTWVELFKPTLRFPVITFDQWLFERQHYDMVDLRDFEPYMPIGNISLHSTVGYEWDSKRFLDIWNKTGYLIYDTPKAEIEAWPPWEATKGLRRYFQPDYLVEMNAYPFINPHSS